MNLPTISSPTSVLWPLELSAILRLGFRDTPDEILTEALSYFLGAHPEIRVEVAFELYRQEQVTLSRAAEIAGQTRWEFQAVLQERQFLRRVEVESPVEMDAALAAFRQKQAAA